MLAWWVRPIIRALSTAIGKNPPREFRIFPAGVTPHKNDGPPVLFDAEAASAVMAEWQAHGADVMVDLEHLSIEKESTRPDANDARAWFKLELRRGELWAVDVRWTPDGAKRLANRTQRYISPAFLQDQKTGRVRSLLNVGLVAMPAMYGMDPLVAASVRRVAPAIRRASVTTDTMDPELIKAALEALESGDQAKALEVLKSLIAAAAGGGAAPEVPPPDALNTDTPSPDSEEDEPVVPASVNALAASIRTELMAEIQKLSASLKGLTDVRDSEDLEARRGLIGELIALNVETPALAWQGDAAKRIPVARLSAASEPLESMRARVIALKATRSKDPTPPTSSRVPEGEIDVDAEVAKLSPSVLATLKQQNRDPKEFVVAKANAVRRIA